MQLKKDVVSLDEDKLAAVLVQLRADLAVGYVDCAVINEDEFYKKNCTVSYTFTDMKNVVTHIIFHDGEPKFGVRLICSNVASILLTDLANHISDKVVINFNNLIQCLNQAIDMIEKVIADEPQNRSDWPTIKTLVSRSEFTKSMFPAEEQEKIEQQIAEQENKLILLKTKLVEHLAIISSLQIPVNLSPRILRDSPILARGNVVVVAEEVQQESVESKSMI